MKIDENNFIQQLRLKNEQALMYVIDEYGGLIKWVIRKNMSGLEGQMEECLNDVLLAIWKNIDYFDEEKNSFKNWVAAVSKYRSIDYMRKNQKEMERLSYEELETEKGYMDKQIEGISEDEISDRFKDLLSGLKDTDREIFTRLYAYEESIDDISEKMKISKPTLYNRISRAKRKLRKGQTYEQHI